MRYFNYSYHAVCPVCGNSENKLLYKVSAKEAANHFLVTQNINHVKPEIIEDKIARLWKTQEAAVVACNTCQFTFADPFIAGDYEFYNLLPHAGANDRENWKWEFSKTLKKIKEFREEGNDLNLIEIGASTGDFVKRVAGVIPVNKIFCLEHSEIGVGSIRKAGIEAHSWNFHELQKKKEYLNKFNVICLFQVLEHLDNLADTFNVFNAISKEDAHLFIGVPNGRKIRFNELNNALLDMPPNHIGRFNKKSFEFLGNKYGWKTEEIAVEPFTPLDVMKTVMYYQSLKRAQFPMEGETTWSRIRQYVQIKNMRLQSIVKHKQLGDTLWVHYRKVV